VSQNLFFDVLPLFLSTLLFSTLHQRPSPVFVETRYSLLFRDFGVETSNDFFILLMFVSLWCLYLYDVCTSMMFVGISMMFDVCCLFILSPSAKLNKTHQSHLVFYTNWKKVKKTKLKWLYYPRSISFEMGLHPSEIIANYFSLTLSAFVQLSFRTNSTKHLKNIFLSYLR
jgi:hypothetical protein